MLVQAAQAMSTSYSAWQPKEYGAAEPDPPGESTAPAQGSADGAPSEGFVFDEATGTPLLMRSKAELVGRVGPSQIGHKARRRCPSWAVGSLACLEHLKYLRYLKWILRGMPLSLTLAWGPRWSGSD